MNEMELLKELIEKKRIAHDLQLRIDIWTIVNERIRFVKELDIVSTDIEVLEKQLVEIEDKSYSREARFSMIEQFGRYITEIHKANPALSLTRNQGLILENELFSGIVRDINYLITDKVFGIRIPAYLQYTTDPNNSVSITELSQFLIDEINILREIEYPNYLILWEYKDQLIERIRKQFIV